MHMDVHLCAYVSASVVFSLYIEICVCLPVCVYVCASVCVHADMCAPVNPMDYSLPGSFVHGIFQASLRSSELADEFFTTSTTWNP